VFEFIPKAEPESRENATKSSQDMRSRIAVFQAF